MIYQLITDTRNEHAVVFFSRINCYSECEVMSMRLKYCIQSKDLREINTECSFFIKIFWIFYNYILCSYTEKYG